MATQKRATGGGGPSYGSGNGGGNGNGAPTNDGNRQQNPPGNGGGGNGAYSDAVAGARIDKVLSNDRFLSHASLAKAVDKGPAIGSPGWSQHFSDQLTKIPWAKQFPDVASWLITSSMPAGQKNAIVQSYPSLHDWVDQNTAMGGTPGVLREAYARALKIQDPTAQQDAVQTLNAFRTLPKNEQQAVMAYAKGTGQYGTQALLLGVQQLSGASSTPTLGTGPDGKPIVNFENQAAGDESTGADIGHVAALESLVPGLKGRIHFSGAGMNFEDFQTSSVNAELNNPFVGFGVRAGFHAAIKLGYGGNSTADLANNDPNFQWGHIGYEAALGTAQAAMLVGLGPSVGAEGVSMGVGAGTQVGLIPTLMAASQILDAPYNLYHESRTGGAQGIGGLPLHIIGNAYHYLDPLTALNNAMGNATGVISRNVYQHFMGKEASDMAANVTLVALLHTFGTLSEAAKTGVTEGLTSEELSTSAASADEVAKGSITTTAAEDAARTEARSGEGLGTRIRGAYSEQYNAVGRDPVKFASHLWSYAVDPMIKTIGRSLTEDTGIADMLRRDAFRRIFDTADAIKKRYPDFATRVGAMNLRMGNLISPETVHAIMDPAVDRAHMPIAAASAIEAASHPELLRAAAKDGVDAASSHLTQVMDERTVDLTSYEEAQARLDQAKAAADVAEQQLAETNRQGLTAPQEQVQNAADAQNAYAAAKQAVDQSYAGADDPRITAARQAVDEAEAAAEDALRPHVPQLNVPTGMKWPQVMHKMFWDGGISLTKTEGIFKAILTIGQHVKEWTGKALHTDALKAGQPFWEKFTDRIRQNDNGYWDPTQTVTADEKASVLGHNSDVMRYMLSRLGVPQDLMATIMGKMAELKPGEFNDFMGKEVFGTSGLVARFLPDDLPADVRNRILTIGSRPVDWGGVERKDAEGRVTSDPVIYKTVDGDVVRKPSLDTDFRNYVQGPSLGDIDMAVNRWKRMAERGKSSSARFPTKVASFFYRAGNTMLTASKVIMMPASLSLGLPFIIMHKLASEALGNAQNADITRNFVANKDDVSVFGEKPNPYTTSAQEVTAHSISDINSYETSVPVRVSPREALRDSKLTAPVVQGVFDQLERLRSSTIVQHLIRYGLNDDAVRQVAEEMQGGDKFLTGVYDGGLKALVEDPETNVRDITDYLQRQVQEIKTYTFQGDPAALSYVEHGYIPSDVAQMPEDIPLSGDYRHQQARAAELRDEINQLSKTDPSEEAIALLKAKQAQLRAATQRMRDMEAKVGWDEPTVDVSDTTGVEQVKRGMRQRLDKANATAVKSYLKDRMTAGELELPKYVEARAGVGDLKDMSLDDRIKNTALDIGNIFSKPLNAISTLENKGPRGAYFGQRFAYWYKNFQKSAGSDAEARAFALVEAGRETADMYYDISARSTMERATRNFFWFAPVTAQLAYHWAYAYPATNGGWIPGAFTMYAKIGEYINFAKELGLVHEMKDRQGQTQLAASIPVAALFNKLFGSDIKGDVNIPLSGVFSHTSFGTPTLSPLPGMGLQQAAKFAPQIEGLSQALAPFTNVSFFPSDIHSLLGAFGIPLPDMMPSYVDSAWNKTHDQGLQYAWTSMYEKGDRQPEINAYIGKDGSMSDAEQAKYETAWKSWFSRLNALANDDSKTLYAMKTLTGGLDGWYTSDEEKAYYDWYDKNIAPKETPNGPPSEALKLQEQNWLAAHPSSLAFSISTGEYTGKDARPYSAVSDFEQRARQMYAAGVKSTMNPQDYGELLAGMTQQSFAEGRRNAIIQKVAGNGNVQSQVVNLLTNWGADRQAYDDFNKEETLYKSTGPGSDVQAIVDHHFNLMRQAYGEPPQSVDYRMASTLLNNMLAFKDDMDPTTYANVSREIGTIKAKSFKEGQGTPTPLMAGLTHYFDTVLDPYYKAVTPLYAKIDAAKAANLDTSALYEQVSAIKQKYDAVKWKGVTLPSPDAFSFGKLTDTEQEHKIISWQSEPISYLSAFQRKTAGYGSFANEDAFWNDINQQRTITANAIKQRGYSPGSTQYEATQAWEQRAESQIAAGYGQDATAALALDGKAPAYKINAENPEFSQNPTWTHVLQMVDYVNAADQKTYAYGTKTAYIDQLKGWVYSAVQDGEQSDPKFRALMEQLHMSYTINNAMPTGVPLYEAVFFGNFNTSFEDKELAAKYAPPAGVW